MKSKIVIMAGLVLLLAGLAGCTRISPAIYQSVPAAGAGSTAPNVPSAAAAAVVDTAKAAESEQWYNQGLALYDKYQYAAAASTFDKAIAADPTNYKVYTAKGIDLAFQGKYQEGMVLINKTLAMKPGYLPACYDMAMAYKLQKEYDQSLIWFQKVIQGDPGNTWSYYGIATIYADRGDFTNSLIYLRQAIALDNGVKAVARRQAHFDKMRSLPEFQTLVK